MPLIILNNIKKGLFGVLFLKTSYICAKRGYIRGAAGICFVQPAAFAG